MANGTDKSEKSKQDERAGNLKSQGLKSQAPASKASTSKSVGGHDLATVQTRAKTPSRANGAGAFGVHATVYFHWPEPIVTQEFGTLQFGPKALELDLTGHACEMPIEYQSHVLIGSVQDNSTFVGSVLDGAEHGGGTQKTIPQRVLGAVRAALGSGSGKVDKARRGDFLRSVVKPGQEPWQAHFRFQMDGALLPEGCAADSERNTALHLTDAVPVAEPRTNAPCHVAFATRIRPGIDRARSIQTKAQSAALLDRHRANNLAVARILWGKETYGTLETRSVYPPEPDGDAGTREATGTGADPAQPPGEASR